jgi:hypothetical protein
LHLYDKVRQDLFEERQNQPKKVRAPSITTIFLLQIQAYIVQLLFNLPPVEKSRNHNALSSSQPSFFLVYQLKRLHIITSIRSIVRHCLRWILLAALLILDNIARVLNVEREMFEINNQKKQDQLLKEEKKPMNNTSYHIEEDEDEEEDFIQSSTTEDTYRDDYYLQKKSSFNLLHQKIDQCTNNNKRGNTNGMNSEPSSPTLQKKFNNNNGYYSPVHSPTPNFIRSSTNTNSHAIAATTPTTPTSSRPSSAIIQKEFSPNLNPSRANYNRARSLSNNMIDQTNKQQKLRRITGQREITVQNAILPIPSRNSTSKKPPTKASSVASRSSSSESSQQIKPKMQKTQSLSTAQQYHQQHHHHHHHHTNEVHK